MKKKIMRALRDPIGTIRRKVAPDTDKYRVDGTDDDYNARRYWNDRLSKYRHDLRGVGKATISHSENKRIYEEAKETFLSLCRREDIDFKASQVLEIGCGTGFYTGIVHKKGARRFLGVDITDTMFPDLEKKYFPFRFRRLDISQEKLHKKFDIILMIDVTQHITNEKKFRYALKNIRESLRPDGIFIVTSWLDPDVKSSFYERSRSLDSYERAFSDHIFGEPVPFRDKFIFTIRMKPGE